MVKKSNFSERVDKADKGFKNFNKKVNNFDSKSRKPPKIRQKIRHRN